MRGPRTTSLTKRLAKDGVQDVLTSKRMTDERKNLIPATSEFFLYSAPDGAVKVRVLFKDETAWLTQKALAELFGVKVPAITKHLKNIFDSGELQQNSVVSILETTAADGKTYETRFYNLDAIIAVGYRVNSYQATQFRIWATKTLREFIIKGFALDDDRLKQGKAVFGNLRPRSACITLSRPPACKHS